jgi:signal transduction histidine kinase/ligand-binding sensor domain-containing protein
MRLSGLVAAVLSAQLGATGLFAADGPTLLSGFNLTSWTQKDGLASPLIWSVAQDQVGYLWLGTDAGALRFDGVRFVPWDTLGSVPNPSASVRSVCVARDGTIWFGLGEPGGVVSLKNGLVHTYGSAEGMPEGVVMTLAQGPDGTIWAGGRFGLYRLSGNRFEPGPGGLPSGTVNALFIDGDGMAVGTSSGVFRLASNAASYERAGDFLDNARSIVRDDGGRLWVADPISGARYVEGGGGPVLSDLKGRGARLMHDSRGNLWVGTGGQGLWRVRQSRSTAALVLERTSTATGLSDDGVTEIFEDREGNIWVATRDGLNRLTPHKMVPITDLGIATAVDAAPDGRVWVGTVDAVVSFGGGQLEARSNPIPLPNPPLAAMRADRQGTLWVATAKSLLRVDGDQSRPVPLRGVPITEVTDLTPDGAGGVWLHDAAAGLLRWRDGSLSAAPIPRDLVPGMLLASYTDSGGRAWFSFDQSRIVCIEASGTARVYDQSHGLTAGPYRAIYEDRDGVVWFGGEGGLTRYSNKAFATLSTAPKAPIRRVTGIVDDDRGALWLAVDAEGLIRLSREEIMRAEADRAHTLQFAAYDKVDGTAGTSRWFGHNAATGSSNGRLWFVAGRGVTVVDPSVLGSEHVTDDTVRIEGAVVDGQVRGGGSAQELPPATARVQIDYTVLDLTSPQKRRFRYRLDGFDADWVDAGNRHSAVYTNLPPRAYTFRVMATNGDGTFTGNEAEWPFTIRPAFYQTWWFATLTVAAAAFVVGAAWRMHVLRMRRQFSLLVGERARLSREVHDTLLQSMFGYALQFDALAQLVPESDPNLRGYLARLRHQVEDDIRDARQSIWNLRSPRLEVNDLPSTLEEAAKHAVASTGLELAFDVTGSPHRAPPHIEEQLLRIGREAVFNVVRHAHASHVHVLLDYAQNGITLTVVDDGRGFDAETQPQVDGHFGLMTMRERAESAGGSLQVQTKPGSGTTVIVTAPAA